MVPLAIAYPQKRRRWHASAAAPPAKKAYTSPFHEFCLEQRPLLPPGSRQERERRLGELSFSPHVARFSVAALTLALILIMISCPCYYRSQFI